jgi:hypothetical protein
MHARVILAKPACLCNDKQHGFVQVSRHYVIVLTIC